MAGMYPNNQNIEIFGEQVSWPGVDATGKFSNGSFSDPMVKPSFIPAETINLIIDNLESIITKCGGTPNAISKTQVADALLNKILDFTPHGYGMYSEGRDLRLVFGIESTNPTVYIPLIMAEIRRRCNNYGEIDSTKNPYFLGIAIGDYIDGLNLSGIPATPGNNINGLPLGWIDSSKSNRIVVGGFNIYKENDLNNVLFIFKNGICRGKMNSNNTYVGGYSNSEMRIWLEGEDGDGSGVFATALKTCLGGDYLATIYKKGLWDNTQLLDKKHTVWLPTEIEVFGHNILGSAPKQDTIDVQFPIYQQSNTYRTKKSYTGVPCGWLLSTPLASNSSFHLWVHINGSLFNSNINSGDAGYISPNFCVY